MATIPSPHAWVAGDDATAASLQSLTSALTYILATGVNRKPIAGLRQATPQSIPTATYIDVALDASDLDTDGGHSNISNNTRYTAQTPGYYSLSGTVSYNYAPAGGAQLGARGARLLVNGFPVLGGSGWTAAPPTADIVTASTPTRIVYLNGTTDYVTLNAWQTSGVAVATFVAGANDLTSYLSIRWETA